MAGGRKPRPLPEIDAKVAGRFWKKVARGKPDECWVWLGAVTDRGNATLGIKYSSYLATRVAWAIDSGCDPYPHRVRARCHTPGCVNPRHFVIE